MLTPTKQTNIYNHLILYRSKLSVAMYFLYTIFELNIYKVFEFKEESFFYHIFAPIKVYSLPEVKFFLMHFTWLPEKV